MPKRAPDESLMELCKGCRHALEDKNKCEVFIDPAYQWRKGKCWGSKGPEVIYLAGSIDAHATMEEANEWREKATAALETVGYIVLNPLRGRQLTDTNTKDIIRRDICDIQRSDILLVEMDHENTAYIGTAMEIFHAWRRGKKIVLWGRANTKSHWLRYCSHERCDTLVQAVTKLIAAKKQKGGAT